MPQGHVWPEASVTRSAWLFGGGPADPASLEPVPIDGVPVALPMGPRPPVPEAGPNNPPEGAAPDPPPPLGPAVIAPGSDVVPAPPSVSKTLPVVNAKHADKPTNASMAMLMGNERGIGHPAKSVRLVERDAKASSLATVRTCSASRLRTLKTAGGVRFADGATMTSVGSFRVGSSLRRRAVRTTALGVLLLAACCKGSASDGTETDAAASTGSSPKCGPTPTEIVNIMRIAEEGGARFRSPAGRTFAGGRAETPFGVAGTSGPGFVARLAPDDGLTTLPNAPYSPWSFVFDGTDFFETVACDACFGTLLRVPASGAPVITMGEGTYAAVDDECVYFSNPTGIYSVQKSYTQPLPPTDDAEPPGSVLCSQSAGPVDAAVTDVGPTQWCTPPRGCEPFNGGWACCFYEALGTTSCDLIGVATASDAGESD